VTGKQEVKTFVPLAWIGLLAAAATVAQGPQGGFLVRGEISSASPFVSSLTVELEPGGSSISEGVPVNADGSFEFRSATAGMHELRVTTGDGTVIHQEYVNINRANQYLWINLSNPSGPSQSTGGVVSLQQLRHKIPAKAMKEFHKGQDAANKGNQQEAVEYFRKALAIDPEFADAHNELGVAQSSRGELPQAAEQFQKAIDLAPGHLQALPNLSIVLCKMKRYREAGEVARRALKVAPGLARVRYVLAVSLIAEHGDSAEALDNLQRAAAEIPQARLLAADLLVQAGRREEAARQLEAYLRILRPHDTDRHKIEAWLSQLQP
jgi:tetratricopeptide (TPR) repeat protein